jgi:uncharacterized spore protein YtfJ
MLQLTVDQLARTLCASTILGAPIEAGERVIIPIAEFGFGFAAGEGSGGDKMGSQGGGAGTGGGGGISAVGLVIIHKDISGPEGIQVISVKKKSEIAEIITTIGETVGPHVSKAIEKGSEMMKERREESLKAPGGSGEITVKGEVE